MAGWPVTLKIAVYGVNSPQRLKSVPRVVAARVDLADPDRALGQAGAQHDVVALPERDDARARSRSSWVRASR